MLEQSGKQKILLISSSYIFLVNSKPRCIAKSLIIDLVARQLNKILLPSSSNPLTFIACTLYMYAVLSYYVLYTVSYHPPHSPVSATMFSLEVNINVLL